MQQTKIHYSCFLTSHPALSPGVSMPDPTRDQIRKDKEQQKIRARRPARVTYDLPPDLRKRMKALADERGLPASQLVTLALLRFLQDMEQGQVPLERYQQPSRSPRYAWNLVYPDELLAKILKK
jgi:hypothetical protein